MTKHIVLFFLVMTMLGCGKSTPSNPGTQSQTDPTTESLYQELLNRAPVPLDASKVHLWPGLANIGNTCFMNSALKLMARQKELLKMLDAQNGDEPDVAKLRQAFKAIINMIRLADKSPANTGDTEKDNKLKKYVLNQFRDRMREVTSTETLNKFTNCSQEDADEFYGSISGLLDFNKDTPNNLMLTFLADRTNITEQRIINPGFKNSPDPLVLSLAMTKDTDTNGLIDQFTAVEANPKNTTSFLNKLYLLNLDKSLVIMVKTTTSSEKIRSFTTNPKEQLTLSHLNGIKPSDANMVDLVGKIYVPGEFDKLLPKDSHQKKFNLVAVVVHSGSLPRSGHYYAYIKDADQNWYRQDDNSVSLHGPVLGEIEQKSGDEQGYVYLYEQAL